MDCQAWRRASRGWADVSAGGGAKVDDDAEGDDLLVGWDWAGGDGEVVLCWGWRRRSGMPGAEGADVEADWRLVWEGCGRVGRR